MLLFLVSLPGCEGDVVAVLGSDVPFTLYGVLTLQADTQWVRVYAIDETLQPISNEPLDAVFVSSATAEPPLVWTDSVIVEDDGRYAHVFYAPFAATYGEDYSIEVTRSDGVQTRVDVSVPGFSQLLLPPQSPTPPPVLTASITGDPPKLIRVEVTYDYIFQRISGMERLQATFGYDGAAESTIAGWILPVQVGRNLREIRNSVKESTGLDTEIKVVKITLGMIVASEEWAPPEGSFDPEILVEPGLLSNVEGGFGFVGGGFSLQGTWVPSDTIFVKTSL